MHFLNPIKAAFGFLTIIPAGRASSDDASLLPASAVWFPLVGLFEGISVLSAYQLCLNVFGAQLSIAIVMGVQIVLSGGLHMDGLSDTIDGIAARGSIERRLNVMKQGQAGALGATSIAFAVLAKYIVLNEVSSGLYIPVILLLMPVYAKFSMVSVMFIGRPARQDGLGSTFMNGIKLRHALGALFIAFSISLSASLTMSYGFMAPALASLPAIIFISYFLNRFFGWIFGGLTGDTIGATAVFSEIAFIMGVVAWQRHFI